MYLHLECDEYQPDLMFPDETSRGYEQWRMCPPGRCKFFFTAEGRAQISTKYPLARESFHQIVSLLSTMRT